MNLLYNFKLQLNKKNFIKKFLIKTVINKNKSYDIELLKFCLKSLKTNKININKIKYKKLSLLHLAVLYNNIEGIRLLLNESNINVNITDTKGWTCLHILTLKNNINMFQLLLSKGGNPDIKTKKDFINLKKLKIKHVMN